MYRNHKQRLYSQTFMHWFKDMTTTQHKLDFDDKTLHEDREVWWWTRCKWSLVQQHNRIWWRNLEQTMVASFKVEITESKWKETRKYNFGCLWACTFWTWTWTILFVGVQHFSQQIQIRETENMNRSSKSYYQQPVSCLSSLHVGFWLPSLLLGRSSCSQKMAVLFACAPV